MMSPATGDQNAMKLLSICCPIARTLQDSCTINSEP